ncbi:MAG TPA: ribonuclease E/G, partial [Gemmatimonadaceae bacterium]|nr:ribonuclease E/G [Gemmatimonadaceae bacterium]
MKREILINAGTRETRVAILEDAKLVELLVDRPDNRRMVGDIYLGRVEAVLPGIQAAFVDIGTEKSAFLHASDLIRESADEAEDDEDEDDDDSSEPDAVPTVAKSNGSNGGGRRSRKNAPPIQDALKRGQEIMVQISKEPISTKGPRVTAQISLAGRFLVYIPDSARVGVSRKISGGAERQRLKEQVGSILPDKSGGVIVRTVSEDVTPEALKRDLDMLMAQWKKIKRKSQFTRAPALLHRETGLTRGLVRDLFSAKVDSLSIDSKPVFNE